METLRKYSKKHKSISRTFTQRSNPAVHLVDNRSFAGLHTTNYSIQGYSFKQRKNIVPMFLDKPVQCALIDDTAGRAIAPPVGVAAWGPMKRHHVVARSKIRNFVDNMHAQGKTDMMNNWISAAVKSHFSQGFIGKKADTTKITRLALPLGVTKETVIANGINPANANNFQELSSALQWTAGNIVPGPSNRTDDPLNMDDLDTPLLKITGNKNDYIAVDNMVQLNVAGINNPANTTILLKGLAAAQNIYSIKTQRVPEIDKWELANRKSNKWKVKG